MDTQKDFIHIDDVFKDLRNGEEQEPSGSWLRMKDLLDKEMPAGAPVSAGRSFRRYVIPLVALLLAGGGFTYYKMSEDSKNTALVHSSATVIAGKSTGNNKAGRSTSENPKGNTEAKHIATVEGSPENNGLSTGKGDHHQTGASSASKISGTTDSHANSHESVQTNSRTKNNSIAHTASGTTSKSARPEHNAANADLGRNTAQNQAAAKTIVEQQRIIEAIKPQPATATSNNLNPFITEKDNGAIAKNNEKQLQPENQYNSGRVKPIAATLNNKKIVQTADGNLYKEERDTFKRIDVVSKSLASSSASGKKTTKTHLDTVAITRFERISYVPLTTLEVVALRKVQVASAAGRRLTPVANLKDKIVSNEMVSLVPLANYKVASRRVDPGKFNQLIQNTSQGISNYFDGSRNFYAALVVGGNTSFGNPGAFGLQLGLAGLYQLNERLTLAAELKYVNHFFSNYSLEDESVTFENVNSQQISGIEWLFSGTQRTTTSAYKINSFSALEMPITLSYNLGRVSVFGGLNMAYAFPTKWNKENTVNTVDVQQTRTENRNPFLNSTFAVDEQKDFSSRFGLGYVWGMNYDFSRKVSLDARLTQILWDNNNGNTDAIKRLFHVPTLQVSIGYYFGRKDKIVYIMDKR